MSAQRYTCDRCDAERDGVTAWPPPAWRYARVGWVAPDGTFIPEHSVLLCRDCKYDVIDCMRSTSAVKA